MTVIRSSAAQSKPSANDTDSLFGYHGRALVVDLGTGVAEFQAIPETVLRAFIGGTGLGAWLLYQHCPKGADPLGPENPLIFVTSPLVGSRLTTSSKFAVVTKSPLTGFIGDSLSSSFMATELKRGGFDALVIKGACDRPTLLKIESGEVALLDATNLSGKSTSETEKAVKEQLGRRFRVACIGPAGESRVRFASIRSDGGRQAGRTGVGAVMGAKRLKAIAVRGSAPVQVADPEALNSIGQDLSRRSLGPATEKYRTLGTMANVEVFSRLGALPTRNFQNSTFEGAVAIGGERFHSEHRVKNAHCANCTIGCEHVMKTQDGGRQMSGRMEYESAFALGSLLGISDPNTVLRASVLCDELGMDTISAGVTLAWSAESAAAGLFDDDTDSEGLAPRFGDGASVLKALEAIANRQGLGDLLAEGSRRASERIGGGSGAWAMHVKGLEMPGYEPRSLQTMALALAVSTRGACHNRSSAYEADFSDRVDRFSADRDRGEITAGGEDHSALMDSLVWCKFLRKTFDDFYAESAVVLSRVTGWEVTSEELNLAGERINNLKKLFNIREGWQRSDDSLPRRILTEKLGDGPGEGVGLNMNDLNLMIDAYYEARDWNQDGTIPASKLHALGLDPESLLGVGVRA
jgi:aldehyde:ferredoxin oxidoreductase